MLFNFASLIKAQFCIFYAIVLGFEQCWEYFQKAKKRQKVVNFKPFSSHENLNEVFQFFFSLFLHIKRHQKNTLAKLLEGLTSRQPTLMFNSWSLSRVVSVDLENSKFGQTAVYIWEAVKKMFAPLCKQNLVSKAIAGKWIQSRRIGVMTSLG